MPAATAPIGKPAAPGGAKKVTSPKPAGFTKPAGLSRQTAQEEEEEEAKPASPAFIGINIAALLAAALLFFTVYSTDQTPKRSSGYLFGEPATADVESAESSAVVADDSEEEASAEEENSESSDSESSEEEEEEE